MYTRKIDTFSPMYICQQRNHSLTHIQRTSPSSSSSPSPMNSQYTESKRRRLPTMHGVGSLSISQHHRLPGVYSKKLTPKFPTFLIYNILLSSFLFFLLLYSILYFIKILSSSIIVLYEYMFVPVCASACVCACVASAS